MIIQMDIDGVLADLHTPWLAWYNYMWNDHLTVADIHSWDIQKYVKPACGTSIFDYLDFRWRYRDEVEPYPYAKEFVERLQQRHRVVFVTREVMTLGCPGRKFDWLKQHGFTVAQEDYVECHDKSLIMKDVAIDDNPEYLKGARIRMLFDQPWNRSALPLYQYDFRIDASILSDVIDYLNKEP